ncbi:MAG: DinB family protein [Chloroflexia bacterium]
MEKQLWWPVARLIGYWEGTGEGQSGVSRVERTYKSILSGRFIQAENRSVYEPQEGNPNGEVHEDLGLFSYDKARQALILRQFHVEGFVNQYMMQTDSDQSRAVFTTEQIENIPAGWRARETYTFAGSNEMEELFELAAPGEEFATYTRSRLKRSRLDRNGLLELVRITRGEWDDLLAGIPKERMTEPGVGGDGWTVKDVIAHNTWNELEMVKMLGARDLSTGSDELWMMTNDERNQALFERDRDLSLDRVLAEAEEVREGLFREVEKLEDADLNDPGRFANMPEDWVPWQIIAGCTFAHYPEHVETVREWLQR